MNELYPENPILIVEDEPQVAKSFEVTLKSAGINNVITCLNSTEVIELLSGKSCDLILLDLNMPDVSGEDLLRDIKSNYPSVPVMVITANDNVATAVQCMADGASDYMVKPVNQNRLTTSVKRILEMENLRKENDMLRKYITRDELTHPEAFSSILTQNERMHRIFSYIEALKHSTEPVLITGETGVGKELFAKAVHNVRRPKGPFIAVNVAGLDDNMLSDSLFGHEKGAFTHALAKREGLIEKAQDGTLFLDEIGDLSPASQVKLLRLLQENEYYPLGADSPKYSNAQIVVATNIDLKKHTEDDKFRRDLYYRLQVHSIEIPLLKKRKEDIPLLVEFFLEEAAEVFKKNIPVVPNEIYHILSQCPFPGNVRELRALIFDALSLNEGDLLSNSFFQEYLENQDDSHKTTSVYSGVEKTLLSDKRKVYFSEKLPTLKDMENILIEESLRRAQGNQSTAANLLGITRQALNYRVKQLRKRSASSKSVTTIFNISNE